MWCVLVIKAEPDYKRPSASVECCHYATEQEAKEKQVQLEKSFIVARCERDDSDDNEDEDDIAEMNDDSISFAQRVQKSNLDDDTVRQRFLQEAMNDFYIDSYMEMPPVEIRVFEVKVR